MMATKKGEYTFDVGDPHILFTNKNTEVLEFILSTITSNVSRRRGNNKILFKNGYAEYPLRTVLLDS